MDIYHIVAIAYVIIGIFSGPLAVVYLRRTQRGMSDTQLVVAGAVSGIMWPALYLEMFTRAVEAY